MSKKTIYKFSELSFEDFKGISEVLKRIFKSNDNMLFENISRFFPNLQALGELALFNIYKSQDEEEFNNFKNRYPDQEFDTTGRSELRKSEYWLVTLEALDVIYSEVSDSTEGRPSPEWQIKNAKELTFLEETKTNVPLAYNRLMFFKHSIHKDSPYVKEIEDFMNAFHLKECVNKLYNFLWNVKEDVGLLLYYLRMRLYILYKNTTDIKHESLKEFEEKLRTINKM